jgi:hypothetical protein
VRVLLAALVLLIVAAPPAAADPPWTAPVNVSSAHEFVDFPTLAFAQDGSGLATWRAQDGVGSQATGGTFGAALGSPDRLISRTSVVSAPALYATSRAVVATQRPAGDKVRLSVVFGRANGTFGAPRTIAVCANIRSVQLAANPAGDVALAWFEDRGVANDRVYVAFRPHGEPFSPPILEATDRVRSVSVAVSPRGDLLLAWDARGIVRTRFKPARAPLFRRADTIASDPAFFAALRTAVTGNGRAYVAWAAQLLTEGGTVGDSFYEAAVQPAGAARFRAAQLLERRPPPELKGGLDLVVDDANRATVAWGATEVRAATTDARAVLGAAQTIGPGLEAALASAPDGRRLVAWIANPGDAGDGALQVAVAPGGGAFGVAETVTTGPEARVPAAAFDARANLWAVVWSNRPAGEMRPIQTFLQASLRPASPAPTGAETPT